MDKKEEKEFEKKAEIMAETMLKTHGKWSCQGMLLLFGIIIFLSLILSWCTSEDAEVDKIHSAGVETISESDDLETPEEKPVIEEDSTRWLVKESIDEMTDTKNVWKSLDSENIEHFSFPYEGGSSLNLCVRYMKKYGTDVILTISKGQLLSNEYNGTNYVTVRFDDDAPQKFYTNDAADGSSDYLFLANARKFIKRAKTAKSIKIQVPVYQEGNPTFTFKVDVPLTWEY